MLLRSTTLSAIEAKNIGLITDVFLEDSFKEHATANVLEITSQNTTVSSKIILKLSFLVDG